MVCQKLCQNSVKAWGSLVGSHFASFNHFQPIPSNLGATSYIQSQGTQDLQLRWQVFQESAELRVIKLASEQNGSDRPTWYAPVGACGWEDITGIPDTCIEATSCIGSEHQRNHSFSGRKPLGDKVAF